MNILFPVKLLDRHYSNKIISDSSDECEWQEVTSKKRRERGKSQPCQATKTCSGYKKEVLLITSAPSHHPVKLREVPRELDWKFADNYPPPSEVRRHYASLSKDSDYLLGTSSLKDFCKEKHLENIKQFTTCLEKLLTLSSRCNRLSGCKFQCIARLGKTTWYVDEKLLCQQPFTLEKFNQFVLLHNKELMVKEDMCARTTTDEAKMLSKLCTIGNFDQKEVQKSIYLQFVDRESDGSVIHRAEAIECSDGSFQLKEFWCAKPLHTYKADFICLGRAHDFRIVCRCTENEMADDVREHIETVINSCVRSRDEFLQMILQTDRVVVRHVYEREVHRFQSHDGWVINFINYVDHIIDCPVVEQKTTIPSGHECQEIEVMLEREFAGQRDFDEMKEQALKMIDFAMDLVDMAEECLDPEQNVNF